MHNLCK